MSFSSQSLGCAPNAAASQSTLGYAFNAAMPVGTLVVIEFAGNVASMGFTIADNSTQAGAANAYNVLPPVAGATLTGVVAWCVLTRALLTGDIVTLTATGGPFTRAAGIGSSWTPSNANCSLDKTAVIQNATTSPVVTAGTGTLSSTTDLAICSNHWKGGAVASGHSNTGTIGGSATASLSGGTTPRIEVISQQAVLAASTSITGGQTYTSITAGCAQLVTFIDPVPVKRASATVVRRNGAGH